MSASSVLVGIGVAKAHVDASVLGSHFEAQRFDNEAEVPLALAAALKPLGVALVMMEATGGYEAALACALQAAGLPVAVVNPRQARGFAGLVPGDRGNRALHTARHADASQGCRSRGSPAGR